VNLPNKITLARVVLIPAFLAAYMLQNEWLALILFVTAAVTDAVDGYLARRLGLVTNFGKLMDPLADKILVCSAFIAFTATGTLPAWVVIILISREFYVSGLRQLALEQKIVVAASTTAKLKTIIQIVLVIYFLLPYPFDFLNIAPLTVVLIVLTTLISVYSAVEYTYKNRAIFRK
jgi:CDP-diacylglycerol--glycerol-3-phosphate 3-phosphatidyltransferase